MTARHRGCSLPLFPLLFPTTLFLLCTLAIATSQSVLRLKTLSDNHRRSLQAISEAHSSPLSAPSPHPPFFITVKSRIYHVTDYGADPTGKTDSTAAISQAIADAFTPFSSHRLMSGIPDLGGAEVHLDGGTYLISLPLCLPSSGGGNIKIHGGTLRASDDFPTDRYVIELRSKSNDFDYEYVNLAGLMVDSNFRGGGIAVVDSLRTIIDGCYVVHFATDGIWVKNGHETIIRSSYLGQHITAGGDRNEKHFSGTGIRLEANDNIISNVVIFSAATGVVVAGQANTIDGVHCYNKATAFGGTGIYVKTPGLTQNRIVNCYLDYTGIVAEDPVQLLVSGSFFLGDANVVLRSVHGVIRGVQIVDNMFSGRGTGVGIVWLDETRGPFTAVDQVVVERNTVDHMRLKSTTSRASVEGTGTTWTVDFRPVLLFPNRIDHVQYSLSTVAEFAGHALRNISGNRVVIESDRAVTGDKDNRSLETWVFGQERMKKAFVVMVSTMILTDGVECYLCMQKNEKTHSKLPDQEHIETISYNGEKNMVTTLGPFGPQKEKEKLLCKA
ncbi:hypothetical protein HPP92_027581 [Vanilla planifolia]|uniref:Rhamnogalacturonase A/B/Epimerase-like pectate lyase domain-containing protein n=1 Tax=Vanilla planifolia TaxID=51239 RepID=A0A835P8B7_VANPL|nr:hypothetical protein HPP92_027581 [Vanilla planifolia]